MAKLLEKNGAEMCAALVSLAAPVKSFLEDQEFNDTLIACTKKGMGNQLREFAHIYADMTPLLFGDKHIKDTMQILAVIEGKTVKELMKMNGTDLIADAISAWKEQIQPFFTRLGLSV